MYRIMWWKWSGKSTLLDIIAGISTPTTGTVQLGDTELQKDRRRYVREIGYMPDDFHAQQSMTVQEFLSFYAAFSKCRKRASTGSY